MIPIALSCHVVHSAFKFLGAEVHFLGNKLVHFSPPLRSINESKKWSALLTSDPNLMAPFDTIICLPFSCAQKFKSLLELMSIHFLFFSLFSKSLNI